MNRVKREMFKAMNKLDCNVCDAPCPVAIPVEVQEIFGALVAPQKKEKTMYKDERTEAQQAKDYLIESLNQATYAKEQPLMVAFGLQRKEPQTIGELKQMVKDGWLRIDTKDRKDETRIYSWLDYVKFSDPKVKRDEAGFHDAWKEVTKAASDVKDAIVVLGPEKGLEALNEFKARDFSK